MQEGQSLISDDIFINSMINRSLIKYMLIFVDISCMTPSDLMIDVLIGNTRGKQDLDLVFFVLFSFCEKLLVEPAKVHFVSNKIFKI